MSEHTPGPFSVGPTHHENEGKSWLTFSSQADILHPNGLTSLACVDVAEEEGEANARLFAAAPDLLAASEALLDNVRDMIWHDKKLTIDVVDAMAKAVNKAKGGAA